MNNETVEQVARVFSRMLSEDIGHGAMLECVELNRTPEYAKCCASHDYCDANMVMQAAVNEVLGTDPDTDVDMESVLDVVNPAWELAKAHDFWVQRRYQTEDGYTLYLQADGTVTDARDPANADMTWPSFTDLVECLGYQPEELQS